MHTNQPTFDPVVRRGMAHTLPYFKSLKSNNLKMVYMSPFSKRLRNVMPLPTNRVDLQDAGCYSSHADMSSPSLLLIVAVINN